MKSVCEGDDAVVVRLGAAHHALAPPVPDNRLRGFGTRTVIAVERAGGHVVIELCPVGGQLRLEIIEHRFGGALRIGVGFTISGGTALISTALDTLSSPWRTI